jgi:hypothetical protein
LTINLAQRHLKDLDRLQRVIAEERGWYFNHGDLPEPKFTMILNGSYCPDDENPADFDMRNLKFTNEFVEQISIDNDLDITDEQIERIVSEIMVSDKVEVCYPTHHKESTWTLRREKYNTEHEAAATDLETTVDALFFNNTMRVITQSLFLLSQGRNEPYTMTMLSLYNNQFRHLAKATDFESTLRTALLKSSGRNLHTEVDQVHGYDR